MRTIRIYVGGVAAIALAWALVLYARNPVAHPAVLIDSALLCGLALTGELLSFLLPRSASGSIGFIPYFAAALVVPSWPSVVSVVLVKAAVELWSRRVPLKATLNVSAHALMELVAITVYLELGGRALRDIPDITNLSRVTIEAGAPALAAFFAAALINNTIVNGAIALSSARRLATVVRANSRVTVGIDFLAAPLIFVFAWVYAAFGAIAAAALWVPILGLRQVHRTNLELERTNEELFELMVKSLEARDPYTSGHSRRVQHYSKIIARAIGLSDSLVEHVGKAALLHDVGKIHEKYAHVLSKGEKLSPDEWSLIQEHPADGANLVATVSSLSEVVPAIRGHHENWDGTGYPDGLAGEMIPLPARIIRFADTIDAMTTERPYRAPLSESQVRSEIARCRGSQFDPNIADKLLSSPLWRSLFAPEVGTPSVEAPKLTIVEAGGKKSAARA